MWGQKILFPSEDRSWVHEGVIIKVPSEVTAQFKYKTPVNVLRPEPNVIKLLVTTLKRAGKTQIEETLHEQRVRPNSEVTQN